MLLAEVNDLLPHSMSIVVGEVDSVVRQREVSGKISAFVFKNFLLRLELGDITIRSLESAKYIRVEAKLRNGVVRVRSQDTRDVFVPLIISDPAAVG